MKNFQAVAVIMVLVIITGCSGRNTNPIPPRELSERESAELWLKSATPGLAHERLRRLVGKWEVESRFWSAPGVQPEVDLALAHHEMILDGRFVEERYSGTAMGREFSGFGLVGFDNVSQQYVSIWTDSLSTGVMQSTGRWNTENGAIDFTGSYNDPMTGRTKSARSVTTLIDHQRYKFEMFDIDENGREFKSLELRYRKVG